jgi:RNA polymerase sigma-70 factor (ECF subfamily)
VEGWERQLLARCQQGDRRALEEFVARYHGRIHAFVMRQTGNDEMAREITQQVFLNALRALPRFEHRAPVTAWLLRIAVNICRNAAREQRAARTEPLEPDLPVADSVPEAAERDLRAAEVRAAVLSLPPSHREVLVLRHYLGYSLAEIARILGLPLGTVKSRLHYGLDMLRKRLQP